VMAQDRTRTNCRRDARHCERAACCSFFGLADISAAPTSGGAECQRPWRRAAGLAALALRMLRLAAHRHGVHVERHGAAVVSGVGGVPTIDAACWTIDKARAASGDDAQGFGPEKSRPRAMNSCVVDTVCSGRPDPAEIRHSAWRDGGGGVARQAGTNAAKAAATGSPTRSGSD
jgi:hypothetical protein